LLLGFAATPAIAFEESSAEVALCGCCRDPAVRIAVFAVVRVLQQAESSFQAAFEGFHQPF
jgi:hypothetical protein